MMMGMMGSLLIVNPGSPVLPLPVGVPAGVITCERVPTPAPVICQSFAIPVGASGPVRVSAPPLPFTVPVNKVPMLKASAPAPPVTENGVPVVNVMPGDVVNVLPPPLLPKFKAVVPVVLTLPKRVRFPVALIVMLLARTTPKTVVSAAFLRFTAPPPVVGPKVIVPCKLLLVFPRLIGLLPASKVAVPAIIKFLVAKFD